MLSRSDYTKYSIVLVIAISASLALLKLVLAKTFAGAICIEVPHLKPMSSYERVTFSLVVRNSTKADIPLRGVQTCCGLRQFAVPKVIPANSHHEICFEGIIPNWEMARLGQFQWNGILFYGENSLMQTPFTIEVVKKTD